MQAREYIETLCKFDPKDIVFIEKSWGEEYRGVSLPDGYEMMDDRSLQSDIEDAYCWLYIPGEVKEDMKFTREILLDLTWIG